MRFGAGKDIITPAAPTYLACSGVFDKGFTWVHDDVFVRCLVLDDGTKKPVLMAFDLLFHERLLNDRIAAYAKEKYCLKGPFKPGVDALYTNSFAESRRRLG